MLLNSNYHSITTNISMSESFERLIPEVIPQPTIHTHEVTLLLCSRFTLGTKHNINHNPLISNLSKVLRLVLAGLSGCV